MFFKTPHSDQSSDITQNIAYFAQKERYGIIKRKKNLHRAKLLYFEETSSLPLSLVKLSDKSLTVYVVLQAIISDYDLIFNVDIRPKLRR